jgi:hypothetical protein
VILRVFVFVLRHAQPRQQRLRDDRVHVQLGRAIRALVHRRVTPHAARPGSEQRHRRAQTPNRRPDVAATSGGRRRARTSRCLLRVRTKVRLGRSVRRAQGRREGKRIRVDGMQPGERARAGAEANLSGDRAIHVQDGSLVDASRVFFPDPDREPKDQKRRRRGGGRRRTPGGRRRPAGSSGTPRTREGVFRFSFFVCPPVRAYSTARSRFPPPRARRRRPRNPGPETSPRRARRFRRFRESRTRSR